MNERWIRWKPIADLDGKYYMEHSTSNIDGFILVLRNESTNKKLAMIFKDQVYYHERILIDFASTLLSDLDKENDHNSNKNNTLFKVENSNLIKWFSDESYEFSDVFGLFHIAIITTNAVVNIATNYDPELKLI